MWPEPRRLIAQQWYNEADSDTLKQVRDLEPKHSKKQRLAGQPASVTSCCPSQGCRSTRLIFSSFLGWDPQTRTDFLLLKIGSAKTDPVRFKWGFGEGLLKDKFAFFEASKSPTPKRRKLLAKRPFLQAKRALFKTPFELDRGQFFHSFAENSTVSERCPRTTF